MTNYTNDHKPQESDHKLPANDYEPPENNDKRPNKPFPNSIYF